MKVAHLLICVVAAFLAAPSMAATMLIRASGEMTEVVPPSWSRPVQWSIEWEIETSTPDGNPSIDVGQYAGIVGSTTLGGLSIPYGGSPGVLTIDRDRQFWSVDTVTLNLATSVTDTPEIAGIKIERIIVRLTPSPVDLFGSDSLNELNGFGLDDIQFVSQVLGFNAQLFIPSAQARFTGRGTIEQLSITIVPSPTAALLLASALGAFGWLRPRTA